MMIQKTVMRIIIICLIGIQGYCPFAYAEDPANTAYQRGNAFANFGQMESAVHEYTRAIQLNPEYVDAYLHRGNAYLLLGNIEAAIQDYTTAIRLHPDDAFAYANRGNAYAQAGQTELALQDYTQAITLQPNDVADAYYNRGHLYGELDQDEAAIQDFTHTIALRPDDVGAYSSRAIGYARLHQFDAAIQDFTRCLTLEPRNANWYYYRGQVHQDAGHLEDAIQDFTQALTENPRHRGALYQRSLAYEELGDQEHATADLQAYHAIEETSSDQAFQDMMEKGIHAHDAGNYEDALIFYQRALNLQENEWVWYEIGYTYLKLDDYANALDAFEKSLMKNLQYSQAYAQMAYIYSQQQEYALSNRFYFRAFILKPSNMTPLQNIAINLSVMNPATAVEFYKLLLQRFPGNPILLYNFSQLSENSSSVYATIQDVDTEQLFPETLKYLTKMSTTLQSYEIDYFLALTYLAHNHVEDAKDYLLKCVQHGDRQYTNFCQTIIDNAYQVESFLDEQDFLRAIKDLLQIPEKG